MIRKLRILAFFVGFCLYTLQTKATHIVGGEIYYDYLGGNNYKVTLRVYRDCFNGLAPFDNPAFLTVYDASSNVIMTRSLPLLSVTNIPPSINNPCIQTPNDVCVEEGLYEDVINLPPKTGGYYLVYQRCCRNVTILNVINPNAVGATYWEHIPGPEVVAQNSSPRFKKFPPIFICNGIPINFDHSATDADGDLLVYSLCSPFNGLDDCCPSIGTTAPQACASPPPSCPTVNTPPPYIAVPFQPPYTGSFPMSSSPTININPTTGFLSGVPDINGQWVVGVCVQEFRNNILIGTHHRDFQFNVVTCNVSVLSAMQDQMQPCSGYTINFINQSIGGTKFHWDFGVNSLTNDTSNLVNPTYVYPDTGKYTVTLIAEPGKPCSDTLKKTFYVYPVLSPTFTAPPAQCITGNSFNYSVTGTYAPYSTFSWNFGSSASPPTSTLSSPTGVTYSAPGTYPVLVTVKQAICTKLLSDSVTIAPMPQASFNSDSLEECDPAIVTFSNTSIASAGATYLWQVSNGASSTQQNPTFTITPAGVYNVTLTVISNNGCIDTSKFVVPAMLTVNVRPQAGFSFLPTETTIFDPDIYFFDQSVNATSWYYTFGDGESSTMVNPSHHYNNYGDFTVIQTVVNGFGCPDTATRIVKILPEFRFWIPNSFTPAKADGLNDVFMPSIIGVEEYKFDIYDRWGEKIFSTNDTSKGWDGTFKGKLCKQDVYVWMISFLNVVSKRDEYHYGHVTLLR